MDRQEIAMIIAGGGTGGHLFPGIALAEELLKRNPAHRVLFIGTNRGLEKKILGGLGFKLETINVEGLKGRGPLKVFASLVKIPGSVLDSLRIIRAFKPDVVAGVGGYASGPAVLAARLLGIKTFIAEQNAVPGLTNRILGLFVERIFVTFAKSQALFPAGKTVVTGNPIRTAFLSGERAARKEGQPFTVLIFGGSQGAGAINRMVMDSLDSLTHLQGKIQFIHQTGEHDRQIVAEAYQKKGFTAEVYPFIVEMAAAYNRADLLVCRAGATSIAEITAVGKAALLIPLPSAAGDHQTKNAALLADAGAAAMLPERELDGIRLASAIERLYKDPDALKKMEAASASLGNKNAAAAIIDIISNRR